MKNNVDFTAEKDRTLTSEDLIQLQHEVVYTLHHGDFLRMPEMDFKSLSERDPEIYALLN